MLSNVCIWLALTIHLGVKCEQQFRFNNLYSIKNISYEYTSLLHLERNVNVIECAMSVSKHPHRMWYVYNKKNRECVTSDCWAIPVQTQPATGHNYYLKQGDPIRSCSDVKKADPAAADGEYWIYTDAPTFLGCPSKIYCNAMGSGSPREFVTLPHLNTAVYPKLRNFNCHEELTQMKGDGKGKPGTTHFSKIRVNIETMVVVTSDFHFTSGTGTKRRFGEAADCYTPYTGKGTDCKAKGTFHIDTRGTGMIIDKQQVWEASSHKPFPPSVNRSADGTQVDLRCGGACGRCRARKLQLSDNPNEELPWDDAASVSK